ncbi:hypothetical protein L7F22_055155 [Adiantum nelumboides]|nr:hypothetical protein [Adiantum nelumboides]
MTPQKAKEEAMAKMGITSASATTLDVDEGGEEPQCTMVDAKIDLEVFISNGAKCNIAHLEELFGPAVSIAVQDPSYLGYVENGVLVGQTRGFLTDLQHYDKIGYMKCTPENDFFLDLSSVERKDVIYFCFPNKPTAAAATRLELEQLVANAKQNGSIIVYDSAYAGFMTDDNPKSIFEIAGAREVAIKVSSFSKHVGFTGVRLGWTVVPDGLLFSMACLSSMTSIG